VVTPKVGGLEYIAGAAGTVRPIDQEEIFAPVPGVLKKLTVDLGSRVKRGDVLAEIDAPLLALGEKLATVAVTQAKGQVQEVEARGTTARAEVEVAKTFVHEKEATLDSAKVAVIFHQRDLERMRDLQAAAVISKEHLDKQMRQLETARAQASAAEAALANAKADVKVKQSKVAQAEAALTTAKANLQTAEIMLEKARHSLSLTRIVAPFDGVVTQRNYRAGHILRTGDQAGRLPLVTIVRIDIVRVVVDVPGTAVPLTEPGLPVDLTVFAVPEVRLTGYKVSRIGYVEDEKTGTMRAEIDVPNPKQFLRPGMRANATIHLGKGPPDALRVPASAVLVHQKKHVVHVVRDGKAHRTPIEISWQDGKQVEVRSGLKPIDRIVVDPKGLIDDIVPVEIKSAEPE